MWPRTRTRSTSALVVLLVLAWTGAVRAAGIEHPDVGTVALGRAGAYAADPVDGLAMQYNPAGFAKQTGWRFMLDGNWAWQRLTFAPDPGGPVGGDPPAENGAAPFFAPAASVSYGLGAIGPLSGLTFALGGVGPSAIGKEGYRGDGAQRYALISTDYLIGYASAAVAASYRHWLSAGVTFQLVKGTAKFSQAVWSGTTQGTTPNQDSIATVDVSSSFIPTGVFGATVRPIPRLAVGVSYRPGFTFDASGTLVATLPAVAQAIGAQQQGTATDFFVKFPDVLRVGVAGDVLQRLLVEVDGVWERWSTLKTIEIHPRDITVSSNLSPTPQPLPPIIFPKNYEDAFSIRIGAEYAVRPGRVVVRGGYLYETSAIPLASTNVDFGNWERNMVALGASFTNPYYPVTFDIAYAHHFLPTRTVTNSVNAQVVTPCVTIPGCPAPAPLIIGNGTYESGLDVVSISVRLVLDARRESP